MSMLLVAITSKERQSGLCIALGEFSVNLTAICYGICTFNTSQPAHLPRAQTRIRGSSELGVW